ncbi:enhancer of mRNA-decapping protein 3 [Anopheles marshallii]|uniref:enhancer of mRNA-decapping protein 3 n=1 Tax=Anopheles marshallii TaxID=1521116 RepID=UPI00237B9DAC|nr:enhancer of mRNA-decapping protein 3 [Anopheles marshallii]
MADKWVGKSVSIHCRNDIGVFQGIIKRVTPSVVVITKAVRNGIPLKKNNVEVTLCAADIAKLDLISCSNVPSIPSKPVATVVANSGMVTSLDDQYDGLKLMNNGKQHQSQQFQNVTGSAFKLASKTSAQNKYANNNLNNTQGSNKSTSNPIDINGPASKSAHLTAASVLSTGFVGTFGNGRPVPTSQSLPYSDGSAKKPGNGNGKMSRSRKNLAKDSTFGSPDDDPLMMDVEFDFEKNLALFDKQAIWNEIDANQTKASESDRKQRNAANSAAKTKYRHDENVLVSIPAQYRQIEIKSTGSDATRDSQDYVTDEGLVIPSVPAALRHTVEEYAVSMGLSRERQHDFLARGATELALQLLGGSRRLTPNNQHQWPKIVVVCEGTLDEVGISTARQLASHGLETVVYLSSLTEATQNSSEVPLYMATGNKISVDVHTLPPCDLVIASVQNSKLTDQMRKWIGYSRAPVLAIDPPGVGLEGVAIKCSILPILPLDGIDQNDACGRLYLCNIGIPNQIFHRAGIKYKSPFDKFVIPIHRRKDE